MDGKKKKNLLHYLQLHGFPFSENLKYFQWEQSCALRQSSDQKEIKVLEHLDIARFMRDKKKAYNNLVLFHIMTLFPFFFFFSTGFS